MLKSYLMTALRNIRRQKLYSIINIGGLAVTLAVCTFIILFVKNEFTYDTSFAGHHRTYRIIGRSPDLAYGRVNVPWDLAISQIPGVSAFTRVWEEAGIVRGNNVGFREDVTLADTGFFKVFPYPLLYGNPSTALDDVHSAVLSRAMSEKLFGRLNPLGKTISIHLGLSFVEYVVTGVTAAFPENSSVRFSVLIPYENLKETFFGMMLSPKFAAMNFGVSNLAPSAFVKLSSSGSKSAADNSLQLLMKDYCPDQIRAGKIRFVLQPMSSVHFAGNIAWNMQPSSDPQYSYMLIILGALIIITSSVNFINLTIARSSRRFKEIGMRKVAGASRSRLVLQFTGEAMLFAMISLLIALMAVELLLPKVNQMLGMNLSFDPASDWFTMALLMSLAVLVGIISGGYPAIYLSGLRPAMILTGGETPAGRRFMTRGMILFQFVISAGLLISAVVMSQQLDYIHSKDLGFNKANVVAIDNPFLFSNIYNGWLSDPQTKTYMEEISRHSGISGVTCSSEMLGDGAPYPTPTYYRSDTTISDIFTVGPGYISTLGMKLIAGRDFSSQIPSDTVDNVIVNEALVRRLHLKEPIGTVIFCPYPALRRGGVRIIGVVRDFNFESLDNRVAPLVIAFRRSRGWNHIFVRINPVDIFSTMSFLKMEWRRIQPGMPFEYTFLDDHLNALYKSVEIWRRIISIAAAFAVLIGLMGLFGLVSYSIEKRTKEIGIRRILGARMGDIARLLYGEFSGLVVVASVMAWPAAWYFMQEWLQHFTYRTALTVWPFIATTLAVLLMTFAVVLFHSIKAAEANPVESLRYE